MYVPRFNAMTDRGEALALVAAVGAGELVTTGADGYPWATRLPVVWDDEGSRLVLHAARANPHWKAIEEVAGDDGAPALVVVTGPEAYVSPRWYATKTEHGRVVPTWNYSAVHLRGRVHVHHESAWLRDAVTRLADLNERGAVQWGEQPWAVTDAPETYVAGQLRAIVGIEVVVEEVEGKAKLSQNRSGADRTGVVDGLRHEGGVREGLVADAMEALPAHPAR
ncbi:FMN-binding negative transcriptional regulator [Nocardioides guangzhouensis]|uniref:FMN-binding negative transcriptional regulator n=1 Tax=Nocardioides guangzhouensis TaxID=2497878 RepID=A0A4Q4ZKH6_9ACTN|nr:FMN-binding negative transcriptional regulator [Nocardioides guangzhouensis]RYP88031.1 FMN-binding negative transcriptional regulator [Nocardioides guangzhouensis]